MRRPRSALSKKRETPKSPWIKPDGNKTAVTEHEEKRIEAMRKYLEGNWDLLRDWREIRPYKQKTLGEWVVWNQTRDGWRTA